MLKLGVHPKIVQERLGHSTIQMTLDTYSHVAPGLQEAAAARFDEVVGPDKGKRDVTESISKLLAKSDFGGPGSLDLRSKMGQKGGLVAHEGFEPSISSLRGRCPRPTRRMRHC